MKNTNFFGISHPNGEMVLRAVKVLEIEKDFIKQAEEYVRKTRGRFIPLKDPSVIEIVSNEDEWGIVGETDIEGERWMAYCSELDYDLLEDITTKPRQVKSKNEVEELKAFWAVHPQWDLSKTEGFEEYEKELNHFQSLYEDAMTISEDEAFSRYKYKS